jgi:hypothetical protein
MAFTPKTVKVLTRPLLKFAADVPHHVLIQGAMYVGKEMKAAAGEKKKEPATLCDAIDLETGEMVQMIVNAVVKSVLSEEYAGNAYVGKAFTITKRQRVQGKSYDPFNVTEIEVPAELADAAAAAAATVKAAAPAKGK